MRRLAICRVESSGPGDPPGTVRLRPLSMWPADAPWRPRDPETILDDLRRYEAKRPPPKS